MDKAAERKMARQIVRAVAKEFRSRGFIHTKPMYLVRVLGSFAQFVHFHKFSFGPHFRVHLGIRVMNDPFAALSLNGPSIEHAGTFDDSEAVSLACSQKLIGLIEREGLPWFSAVATLDDLSRSEKSPLSKDDRPALLQAMRSERDTECWQRSERLLGLTPKHV